ncbi:hypothetical protein CKAH01_12077 [Colletotrichum kahawae]|uniref:Uncharacterized protein n=1 Tax=Colletotrichum kahawae TaxID=34407 RepID=A0AAD9YUD7_COLKA|nr:hypothetical protein CKAH01_12077 [Colletotrichum kahawae]
MGKPLIHRTFCLEYSEKGKTNPEDYADKVTEFLDAIRQQGPREDLTVSWNPFHEQFIILTPVEHPLSVEQKAMLADIRDTWKRELPADKRPSRKDHGWVRRALTRDSSH